MSKSNPSLSTTSSAALRLVDAGLLDAPPRVRGSARVGARLSGRLERHGGSAGSVSGSTWNRIAAQPRAERRLAQPRHAVSTNGRPAQTEPDVGAIISFSVACFVLHAGDLFARRELAFHYLAAFIALAFAGPGRWSIDAWLSSRRRTRARPSDSMESPTLEPSAAAKTSA